MRGFLKMFDGKVKRILSKNELNSSNDPLSRAHPEIGTLVRHRRKPAASGS